MKTNVEKYTEYLEEAFGNGTKENRLKAFRKAMLVRAEMTSRDQIAVNDTSLLHALRGMNTILFELSDWVIPALELAHSKAIEEAKEGIPE